MTDMRPDGEGRVRIDLKICRGLIGFLEFMTLTLCGLLYHSFDGPYMGGKIGQRINGVLISNAQGKSLGYALFNSQERRR